MALASVIVRRPFTLAIARTQVPAEFWDCLRFLAVNMVLTGIWTAAFAAAAITCALIVHYEHAAAVPLVIRGPVRRRWLVRRASPGPGPIPNAGRCRRLNVRRP
jgi:hypothetical protein